MKRARRINSARLNRIWLNARKSLGKRFEGGALAVHLFSGRWYAGRDSREALLKALRDDPDGEFEVLRLGDRPTFLMKLSRRC